MADLGSVILADSHRRIVERREGVGPDIDYLRGISLHGFHDVQDMFPVQLQEPAADDSGGYVILIDPTVSRPVQQTSTISST